MTAWRIATAVDAEESATEMPSQLGQRTRASMAWTRCAPVGGAGAPRRPDAERHAEHEYQYGPRGPHRHGAPGHGAHALPPWARANQ